MNKLAKDIGILVADNNSTLCKDYVKQLTERGYRALQATDYTALVNAINTDHFDIILMDADFFGKLKHIKKLTDSSDIVMMAAVCDQKLFHKALECGVIFCVLKPADIDNLTLRIDRLIERRTNAFMPLKTILSPFASRE